MRTYVRLLGIFYKNAVISELEYRVNFVSNVLLSLFWLVWAAFGVRVFFFHTDRIANWSYPELLIVVGLFFAINGYRQLILSPNLSRMSEYIQLGTLDYILTRPINSQFLVSLRNLGIYNLGDPLLGLGLVIFGLWRMHFLPTPGNIALFAAMTVVALLLLYSFSLLLQTTTIWLVNLERADALVWGVIEAGRFPINFYRGWVRWGLTVVVPVAFLTTFPAEALLGRLDVRVAVAAVIAAPLAFGVATAFWNYALRSYTSASS